MIDAADFLKWLEIYNVPFGGGGGGAVTESQVQQLAFNYSIDTGIANAYIANLSPVITSFTESLPIYMKAIHANTAASTLTVNGTTKDIVTVGNHALVGGEIYLNNIYEFLYNSTYDAFVLINPSLLAPINGGTGVANSSTLTMGGNLTFIGAHTFSGTLTANTAVTFPVSGILATTLQTFAILNTTGTTQAMVVNTGYISNNAAQSTFTLPATCAVGDRGSVDGSGAGGWILAANTGQVINHGNTPTSSGGSLTSNNQYDSIEVVCIAANTTWKTRFSFSSGLTVS